MEREITAADLIAASVAPGEGGIRSHGTVTTTVFEFYDSRAGAYRLVAKRMLQFANFAVTVSACDL